MKVKRYLAILISAILMLSSAAPVLALDAPVMIKEKADAQHLKNPTITEVDAPRAGEAFDVTAKVTADDGVSYEIPVFWLGTPGTGVKGEYTLTLTESDGKTRKERISYIEAQGENAEKAVKDAFYMPVLAFFLPDQYTCDGNVTLDKSLSDLFEMTGGVMTIEEPSMGITYITGMVGGLTKMPPDRSSQKNTGKPSAEPSENEIPGRVSDNPSDAPDQDAAQDIDESRNDEPDGKAGDRPGEDPSAGPNEEPSDVPSENPIDEPSEDPIDEPVQPEKTKYELFAASYYEDPSHPAFEILFPNGKSDLDTLDWYAYLKAFGPKEASTLVANVFEKEYNGLLYDYLGIDMYSDFSWFLENINDPSQEAYQAMKKEYTDAASEKIKQYSSKNDFYYVRQDDLEALIDTVVNKIQPHAVNLIRKSFPAFAEAGDQELGREVGVVVQYGASGGNGAAAASAKPRSDGGVSYGMMVSALSFDAGRDENYVIKLDFSSKYLYESLCDYILHEDVHLFMTDYDRAGMKGTSYMRTNYTVDDEGNYSIQYLIPGYEPMTLEESQAFLSDYKMYPEWFIEGTANLVSGFYRFNYSKDLFDRAGTSDGSRIIFSEESVRAQYDTEIKMLTASSYDTENQDKFYCYAPLAVMYLSDRHLRSSGKQSALKYDENGVVTDVDVTALRESLSDIFKQLHSEKTLDEIIRTDLGQDCDTFEKMFISGNDEGNTSLIFCTDVLNYLETASQKIGERSSGSILQEFDKPYADLWVFNENETSDYYNLIPTDDHMADSTADKDIANATKGKKDFDLEAYRQEQAEKENQIVGEPLAPTPDAGLQAADAAAAEQPGQGTEDDSAAADVSPADDSIDAPQTAQGADDASAAADASPADDAIDAEQPAQEADDASIVADADPADGGTDAEQLAQEADDASAAVDASPADDSIAAA